MRISKKLPLTPERIQANRRNARRSTGPRTPAGKRRVRLNAVKHGMLSGAVVLPTGEAPQEQHRQLAELLADLRRDLRPRGTLERMVVENIAVCYLRLRRVLQCESGEIYKRFEKAAAQHKPEQQAWEAGLAAVAYYGKPALMRQSLARSSAGLIFLTSILNEVRQDVEAVGHLTRQTYQKLRQYFGGQPDSLADRCRRWSRRRSRKRASPEPPANSPTESESGTDGAGPEELPPAGDAETASAEVREPATGGGSQQEDSKKLIVDALWKEQMELERQMEQIQSEEERQQAGHLASLSLPDESAIRRIVRYEAALQRELHRNIRELKRLQMQRKGSWTPWGPPKLPNKAK